MQSAEDSGEDFVNEETGNLDWDMLSPARVFENSFKKFYVPSREAARRPDLKKRKP